MAKLFGGGAIMVGLGGFWWATGFGLVIVAGLWISAIALCYGLGNMIGSPNIGNHPPQPSPKTNSNRQVYPTDYPKPPKRGGQGEKKYSFVAAGG
jgi:hypothetical protein